jgi:cytochrome c biogenesis protein CcmG/thiol:disulfide interchange protein DsbE
VTGRTAAVLLSVALLAVGCGESSSSSSAKPSTFNAVGLPPIHTDPCPEPADLLAQPAPGGKDYLPDVELECIAEVGSTKTVSLRRLGKLPTVVNLWGSWCVPCRQEMPDLQREYAGLAGKVRLLGVNTDDSAEAARATINQTQISWPSLADPEALVRAHIGQFMPATLFVAADGRIVHRKFGRLDRAQFRQLVQDHLGVRL